MSPAKQRKHQVGQYATCIPCQDYEPACIGRHAWCLRFVGLHGRPCSTKCHAVHNNCARGALGHVRSTSFVSRLSLASVTQPQDVSCIESVSEMKRMSVFWRAWNFDRVSVILLTWRLFSTCRGDLIVFLRCRAKHHCGLNRLEQGGAANFGPSFLGLTTPCCVIA